MGSERINDWLKCCRLCLMDDGVKMPIFGEEGIHREVAKKIESCLPIVIYNTDPLSKLICQRCLFMLDTVYDFHQKCVQTTVVLTNQLLAIKNSSAVTVYLLTLEKNDLLACSTSGKDPKRKHPTPDQIPVEDVSLVEGTSRESRSTAALPKDYSAVQVKQEVTTVPKAVPQIVNVVGSYSGELRELRRRSYTPASVPDRDSMLAPSEIKQEPGARNASIGQSSLRPFKKITPWYCNFCNKYYKNKGTLYKHRKYFCSKKGFECHKCSRVFAVEHDKLVHLATHLRVYVNVPESQLVTCSQCDKRFFNRQMLASHMNGHQYAASLAPVQTVSSDSEASERDRASPFEPQQRLTPPTQALVSQRYSCDFCPRTYAQRGKLDRHKSEEHRSEMFTMLPPNPIQPRPVSPPITEESQTLPPSQDQTVKVVVDQPRVLSLHQRMNRPSPLSKKKCANSPSTLLRELLLKQLGPVPQCEQCNKPFESRQGLANHMRIHLPKNQSVSQKCLECGKMFGSKEGLRYHTNKFHRGLVQNKHHCRICNLSFTSRSEWLLHMVSHPINRKVPAKSDPSDQSDNMGEDQTPPAPPKQEKVINIPRRRNNYRTNVPMMPSCIYCDQEFDEVSELTTHLMTVHGLPRHYPCKVCFKLFAHRSNMARHMKIHSKTNQYTFHPCNICGKKFLSKETADKHAAMHSLSQTFHCPDCNKIFFKMEGLENHECTPGVQSEDSNSNSNDCPSCNFPYTKGHECQYREDGSRIIFIGIKEPSKKKKPPHGQRRTYKCKFCVATFRSSYSHNSHMKIHRGLHQAKNNVILSVPSYIQPHFVEVKPEPVESSFDANIGATVNEKPLVENGFAWMHPNNLEVNNMPVPEETSARNIAPEDGMQGETLNGESGLDVVSDMDIGTSGGVENSLGVTAAIKETKNVSGATGIDLQESVQTDGTNTVQLNVEGAPLECDLKSAREVTSVAESVVTKVVLEETSGDGSSHNKYDSITVKKTSDVMNDDGTSYNKTDQVRVSPHEAVCDDGTSLNKSDLIRVRPPETMCIGDTTLGATSLIRVRPQESMIIGNTSLNERTLSTEIHSEESRRAGVSFENNAAQQEYSYGQSFGENSFSRMGSTVLVADGSRSLNENFLAARGPSMDLSHTNRPGGSSFPAIFPERGYVPNEHRPHVNPMDRSDSVTSLKAFRDVNVVYDCNMCSKAFSTPEELTTHVRWHNDPKTMQYQCPFCGRGFVNSPAVYQHVLMNHKEQRYF